MKYNCNLITISLLLQDVRVIYNEIIKYLHWIYNVIKNKETGNQLEI